MDPQLWHPIVNHFTIALIIVSVFLDVLGRLLQNDKYHFAAWINLLLGGIAGVLTIITGLVAEEQSEHSAAVHDIIEKHETIGFIILGIVVLMVIWRLVLRGRFPGKGAGFYLILALAAVILILVNGFYGGEMVFKHGVGVEKTVISSPPADHEHESGEAISPGDTTMGQPVPDTTTIQNSPEAGSSTNPEGETY